MMEEIYIPIKNSDNVYFISSHGNVKNAKGQILKMQVSKTGYRLVNIKTKNLKVLTTAHRLVALHFIDNPYNKSQVNHIDGDKLNNVVDNLEWATNKENINHAFSAGLMDNSKEKAKARMKNVGLERGKVSGKKISCFDEKGTLKFNFKSARELERVLGFNRKEVVKRIVKNLSYKNYVFKWT